MPGLQREPFTTNIAERDALFNKDTSEGVLANYLLDPKNVFNDEQTKNNMKTGFNLTNNLDLANERFENDIAVLNFFFDTPIITQIGLEMRVSLFDRLSAIGGTLGLYTGISIITMIETVWWFGQFAYYALKRRYKGENNNAVQNAW